MKTSLKKYWHQYLRTEKYSTKSTFVDHPLDSIIIKFTTPRKKMLLEEVPSICALLDKAFGKEPVFNAKSYDTISFSYRKDKDGVFRGTKEKKGTQEGFKVFLTNSFFGKNQLDDIVSNFPPRTDENNYSFKFSLAKRNLKDIPNKKFFTATTKMSLNKFIKDYSKHQEQLDVRFPKLEKQSVYIKFRFLAEDGDELKDVRLSVRRILASWKMLKRKKKSKK